MKKKNLGIYKKFEVQRTDGKSSPGEKHENCRYFVIDIDHDEFAAKALYAYAAACINKYPELANDLFGVCHWINGEAENNPFDNVPALKKD